MSGFVPSTGKPQQPSKGVRIAKRAAIAVLVVACMAALAWVAVNVAFKAVDSSLQKKQVTSLSERTALTNLSASLTTAPDLTGFAYVDTANLIGPRIENIVVGEVVEGKPGTDEEATRTVSASANYRNSSIEVVVPVTQPYAFDNDESTWVAGEVTLGQPVVSPLRAPSTAAIEAALPELLRAHDASLADRFAECSVYVSSNMDEKGGTATATLSKTEKNKLVTCDVNLSATWSASTGWQLAVTSAGKVTTSEANASNDPGTATMSLECTSGELVELTGTIESIDGVIVLRTDETIYVSIDGKGVTTNRFCLTSASDDREVSIDARVTLQGTISAGGSISQAPVTIAVTDIK
ncbi:hypothetical protein [Adlercreutzia sp. ZJ473]|uniref:hypothetical protein n=1 Tax=Adlercreutzia sp. ZJ473 TaxID=2722822 RepID=UPI001557CE7E|nr:hypothetical protein [Adlercreutzia sp. ZJ473]